MTTRSVGDLLGLDEGGVLLNQVRARWPHWIAVDGTHLSVVSVVTEFDDLQGWLAQADRDDVDVVLHELATLAAPDGGGDVVAAAALAKCLLPGASRIAAWFATGGRHLLRGEISLAAELVASQLWLEVRSFPWRRMRRKVAANILMNTRAGVLFECGCPSQVEREDRTWARTTPMLAVDHGADYIGFPDARAAGVHNQGDRWMMLASASLQPEDLLLEDSPLEQLLAVLAWACETKVISVADRELLLRLAVEASERYGDRSGRRGRGGLLGGQVCSEVASRIGVSARTVRRQGSRSIRALADAVPRRFADAG